ncbi:MAG: hypothetical protein QW230_00785 [Thermofilum sp.]
MPAHTFAYYANTSATTPTEITVVKDDVLTQTTTTRFLVPVGLNRFLWGIATGSHLVDPMVTTPSLEVKRTKLRFIPHCRGGTGISLTGFEVFVPPKRILLSETEEISFLAAQNASTPPSAVYGVVTLSVPEPPPPPEGDLYLLKCTGSTTLTANQWTTVTLTPEYQLPVGTYAVIGFLPISASGIAARLIIPGQVWRPGMPVLQGDDNTARAFDPERLDKLWTFEMGRFPHFAIPQVQFLAASADTSQIVYFWLVKTA